MPPFSSLHVSLTARIRAAVITSLRVRPGPENNGATSSPGVVAVLGQVSVSALVLPKQPASNAGKATVATNANRRFSRSADSGLFIALSIGVPPVLTCQKTAGENRLALYSTIQRRTSARASRVVTRMAVYIDVPDEELKAFIAEYTIGDVVSCKGIAEGVENSNYLLRADSGTYILTLYEKRVAPADLPFFLALMEHLAKHGIPCPTPIHGRDGGALRKLCGRPAAIVSFLDGMWPRRIHPYHCASVGGALAQLHHAGAGFASNRANDLSLTGWERLYGACAARADEIKPGLADELRAELAELRRLWPNDLPRGIIHADLFPDNVFFRGETVSGLIDFYFACTDFFAYDLAICLNAWCFESDGSFNVTKAKLLLAKYRAVRPLAAAEIEALPLLARGSAVRFLLTRLYDRLHQAPGAFVRPKDPLEYLQKLRFHRGVTSPAAYGLDS